MAGKQGMNVAWATAVLADETLDELEAVTRVLVDKLIAESGLPEHVIRGPRSRWRGYHSPDGPAVILTVGYRGEQVF